jgi:hypothetical protein
MKFPGGRVGSDGKGEERRKGLCWILCGSQEFLAVLGSDLRMFSLWLKTVVFWKNYNVLYMI